jgi:uncharacterized protein (DUF4415 family)
MARKAHIVRYTEKELEELVEKNGDRSDWKRAASMTDAQIEAAIAADPEEAGMVMDWGNATVELPQPKAKLNMRVDRDVLEYFRKTGKGYQSRINAVLRSYIDQKPHSLR